MKTKQNKSLFLMNFGDTPQLRVMDFLIDNHFFDFFHGIILYHHLIFTRISKIFGLPAEHQVQQWPGVWQCREFRLIWRMLLFRLHRL